MNIAKSILISALVGICVTTAHAEKGDDEVISYIGISGGQSDFNDACNKLSSCDDTDTGLKAFMGMHKKHFGVETAFVWFGNPTAAHPTSGTPKKMRADDIFGVQIQGVGIYPVNKNFSGFAKVGGLAYEGDEIEAGAAWALGVGAQYNFNDTFSVRAEYEWYYEIESFHDDSELEKIVIDSDVGLFSAGLVFSF